MNLSISHYVALSQIFQLPPLFVEEYVMRFWKIWHAVIYSHKGWEPNACIAFSLIWNTLDVSLHMLAKPPSARNKLCQ